MSCRGRRSRCADREGGPPPNRKTRGPAGASPSQAASSARRHLVIRKSRRPWLIWPRAAGKGHRRASRGPVASRSVPLEVVRPGCRADLRSPANRWRSRGRSAPPAVRCGNDPTSQPPPRRCAVSLRNLPVRKERTTGRRRRETQAGPDKATGGLLPPRPPERAIYPVPDDRKTGSYLEQEKLDVNRESRKIGQIDQRPRHPCSVTRGRPGVGGGALFCIGAGNPASLLGSTEGPAEYPAGATNAGGVLPRSLVLFAFVREKDSRNCAHFTLRA